MDNYSKEILDILRWSRTGVIACRIAEMTGLSPLQSLKEFYRSETCRRFHDRRTGLYVFSDYYIADDFMMERRKREDARGGGSDVDGGLVGG